MKNFILTLVIAIVSSVNVFGQIYIDFKINTSVIDTQEIDEYADTIRLVDEMPQHESILIYDANANTWQVLYDTIVEIKNDTVTYKINFSHAITNDWAADTITIIFNVPSDPGESNVSVGSQPEVSNLMIYPNPVQDVLNIRFDSYETVDVVVTDLNGRIVFNETSSVSASVDLSNQPTGIYLVKVGSETRKVVKQ